MFVTLEGVDGAGKSTQARLLADALGPGTLLLREPGGTAAGERLRDLLKDASVELVPRAELMLFCAARAELVDRVIAPALEAGRDVVCDRFVDSTVAYQGGARGIDPGLVRTLNDVAVRGCMPDRTILLRVDTGVAVERAEGRCESPISDRFESEGAGSRTGSPPPSSGSPPPSRSGSRPSTPPASVAEVHARVREALGI